MPNSNDSLIIAMEQETNYRFHSAAMFFVVQRDYLNKSCITMQDLLLYTISLVAPPHKFVRPPCCFTYCRKLKLKLLGCPQMA